MRTKKSQVRMLEFTECDGKTLECVKKDAVI